MRRLGRGRQLGEGSSTCGPLVCVCATCRRLGERTRPGPRMPKGDLGESRLPAHQARQAGKVPDRSNTSARSAGEDRARVHAPRGWTDPVQHRACSVMWCASRDRADGRCFQAVASPARGGAAAETVGHECSSPSSTPDGMRMEGASPGASYSGWMGTQNPLEALCSMSVRWPMPSLQDYGSAIKHSPASDRHDPSGHSLGGCDSDIHLL